MRENGGREQPKNRKNIRIVSEMHAVINILFCDSILCKKDGEKGKQESFYIKCVKKCVSGFLL